MIEIKRWRHGGILAEFREDGTLHIYAPDDSRVMSRELAADLAAFLLGGLGPSDFGPALPPCATCGRIEPCGLDCLENPDEAPVLEAAFAKPRQFEQAPEPGETVPSGDISTSRTWPEVKADAATKRRPGRPRKTTG